MNITKRPGFLPVLFAFALALSFSNASFHERTDILIAMNELEAAELAGNPSGGYQAERARFEIEAASRELGLTTDPGQDPDRLGRLMAWAFLVGLIVFTVLIVMTRRRRPGRE